MHRFVLIRGNRYRVYHEASPITDIYQCEKCGAQVNSKWLEAHPEEKCPLDEVSECMRKHPEEAYLISQS
jgi:hypothetical protein